MTLIDTHGIAGPPMPRITTPPSAAGAVRPARGRRGDDADAGRSGRPADEARLEALYRDHATDVLRFALRRTEASAADDVVAETFLVAWRRRDEVPSDALPWLYAVAGNVLRTQHRSARRLVSLRERIAAEPAPIFSASTSASDSEAPADHLLLRALATLRPIDREAILLTAWEELTAERAAAAAGCSPAAFHVRLHRAKARLAKALERATAIDPEARA